MSGQKATPRVRMFAGPNGSGKTTARGQISRPFGPSFLGVVVDPDELEAAVARDGRLDLGNYDIVATDVEVRAAITSSTFLQHCSFGLVRDTIRHSNRAYFFDTSQEQALFVAESTDAQRPQLRCDQMPNWFKTFVWDKF